METPMAIIDEKALEWQRRNQWFGRDEEKTALALALHERLIKQGVDATSRRYYKLINKFMMSIRREQND